GALAVEWVGGVPPPTTDIAAPDDAPTPAVISRFGLTVNQQAQVVALAGASLREQPSLAAPEIALLNAYEWVVIVGGPVPSDGLIWWRVQTGSDQVGWVAEANPLGVQLLSLEPL